MSKTAASPSPRSFWRRQWGLATVHGDSMAPTLRAGDRLLVWHHAPPRVGDIAVVALPPGPDGPRPLGIKRLAWMEEDARWWVKSDNPAHGTDSRTFGTVPSSAVRARMVWRLPRPPKSRRRSAKSRRGRAQRRQGRV